MTSRKIPLVLGVLAVLLAVWALVLVTRPPKAPTPTLATVCADFRGSAWSGAFKSAAASEWLKGDEPLTEALTVYVVAAPEANTNPDASNAMGYALDTINTYCGL
jgi:hypothetical protein